MQQKRGSETRGLSAKVEADKARTPNVTICYEGGDNVSGVKGKSGQDPNSLKNLTPINERTTPEQRRANASKAGKASAEKKRQRKELREMFEYICSLGVEKGKIVEDIKSLADAEGKNITVGMEIALAQVNKAREGDTRAAEFIRDTMGQKPTNKQEITATIVDSPLQGILAQLQDDEGDSKND